MKVCTTITMNAAMPNPIFKHIAGIATGKANFKLFLNIFLMIIGSKGILIPLIYIFYGRRVNLCP